MGHHDDGPAIYAPAFVVPLPGTAPCVFNSLEDAGCWLRQKSAPGTAPAAPRKRRTRRAHSPRRAQSPYSLPQVWMEGPPPRTTATRERNLAPDAEIRLNRSAGDALWPVSQQRQQSLWRDGSNSSSRRTARTAPTLFTSSLSSFYHSKLSGATASRLQTVPHSMPEAARARFEDNRKDREETYMPSDFLFEDFLESRPNLKSGKFLDLGGWGVNASGIESVAALIRQLSSGDHNNVLTASAAAAGTQQRRRKRRRQGDPRSPSITVLRLDRCWRLRDVDFGVLAAAFAAASGAGVRPLTVLHLNGCAALTDVTAERIHGTFSALESIDVSGTSLTDTGFQLVLGASAQLKTLFARGCPGLTDCGVLAISTTVKRHRRLTNLDLSGSRRFGNDGALALLAASGVVSRLSLAGCLQLTELCLMGLERPAFASSRIARLDLSGIAIADHGLAWVAHGCRHLRELDLSNCPLITDQGLAHLAETAKPPNSKASAPTKNNSAAGPPPPPLPLRVLRLRGSWRVTDRGVAALLRAVGSVLEELALDGCAGLGDAVAEACGAACPALRRLGMAEATGITDAGLFCLAAGCRRLKSVDLGARVGMLELSRRCRVPRLGSEGASELCRSLASNLTFLRLDGAARVGDAVLISAGEFCPALRVLSVRFCHAVGDDGVVAVASGCPQLRHVALGGCAKITDRGVAALAVAAVAAAAAATAAAAAAAAAAGGQLRHLDVGSCRRVTDAGLLAVGASCHALVFLSVRGCDRVSDKGLGAIAAGCPELGTLQANDLADVTEAALAALELRCRRLCRADFGGCPNISSAHVRTMASRLPLAVVSAACPHGRALEPCAEACALFNWHHEKRHVDTCDAACRIQRRVRGAAGRKYAAARKVAYTAASLQLQRCTRRHRRLKAAWRVMDLFRAARRAALTIQRSWRGANAIGAAKATLRQMRKRRRAATTLQRYWRGFSGRRIAARRKLLVRRWEVLSHKAMRLAIARRLHKAAMTAVYCAVRRRRLARRIRRRRAAAAIAAAAVAFAARERARKALCRTRERRRAAATKIQRCWRSFWWWKWRIRRVWLEDQALRRNRFLREAAQMRVVEWWKVVRQRRLRRAAVRARQKRTSAARVLQGWWRGRLASRMLLLGKRRRARARCAWRRFVNRARTAPGRAEVIRLQRLLRRYLRRRRRGAAATEIQRVWRGLRGRRAATTRLARMFTERAITIQRVFRGHFSRQTVAAPLRRQNAAARVLQRFFRGCAAAAGLRRVLRQHKAAELRRQREKRAELQARRAEETVARMRRARQDAAARQIQAAARAWLERRREVMRQLAVAEALRREKEALAAKMELLEARKKEQAWAAKRREQGLGGALRQFNRLTSGDYGAFRPLDAYLQEPPDAAAEAAAKAAAAAAADRTAAGRAARRQEQEEEERRRAEAQREVLANSILNHQTNSILQEGIVELLFTRGATERRAFGEVQGYKKLTKQPYFELLTPDVDLSGAARKKVHLWLRRGVGEGVLTDVKVERPPAGHAKAPEAVRKVRQQQAVQGGCLLVSHPRVPLELLCRFTRRGVQSAPAVDDLRVCFGGSGNASSGGGGGNDGGSADSGGESAALKAAGFVKLRPGLRKFGLADCHLWMHTKSFDKKPEALAVAKHRLRAYPWFTARTLLLMEKYALTDDDAVALHNIFQKTDYLGDGHMEAVVFYQVVGQPPSAFGRWLFDAAGAAAGAAAERLTWDEALSAACLFCLFGRHELLRFIFGALDPSRSGWVGADSFVSVAEASVSVDPAAPRNLPLLARRAMERAAASNGMVDFPRFERLCEQFPRALFPLQQMRGRLAHHFMGEDFWTAKKELFARARADLGVRLADRPRTAAG